MVSALERFHSICIDFRPYSKSFFVFLQILYPVENKGFETCPGVHEDLFQNERNATLFLNHVILDFSAFQISMFHNMLWGFPTLIPYSYSMKGCTGFSISIFYTGCTRERHQRVYWRQTRVSLRTSVNFYIIIIYLATTGNTWQA